MVSMTIEMPEGVFSSLRRSPEEFSREMRLMAAVKWYELEAISQGRAAEIAGLSRSEFLQELSRLRVTPFQSDADEVYAEASRG